MASDNLKVKLSLRAKNPDGSPFSKATHTSYNMDHAQFHEMETGLAELLVGFGDQAVQARAGQPTEDEDEGEGEGEPE